METTMKGKKREKENQKLGRGGELKKREKKKF